MGHGVQPRLIEGVVGDRVGERDGRHVEHDAQQDERVERVVIGSRGGEGDEPCGAEVTKAQEALCRNPSVCDDAHNGRHEQRGDSHRGEETADLQSVEFQCVAEVGPQRDQPCSPNGVLEKVHQGQANFDIHKR